MSKVISKESLEDCHTWEPPSVNGSPATSGKAPAATGSPMTAAQIEAVQRAAYEEAYQSGLEEGRRAGQREVAERVRQWEELLEALATPFEALDEQVDQELVALVIALLRQLVRRELRTEPGEVIGVVRDAMAMLPAASRRIRVHLHPEDAALVREALSSAEDERAWSIVEDPILARGGCRVVTEQSQIDASLETRINQLIADVFGGERESDG